MFPESLKAIDLPAFLAFAKDRAQIRQLWEADDTKTITIVALDLEKSRVDDITEIGLSSQPARKSSKRVTRHILVDSNHDKKRESEYIAPGFGVITEHVCRPADLRGILDGAIRDHETPSHEVVLTGFAICNDLQVLFRAIDWLPPHGMRVIDAQHIWASFFLPPQPRATLPRLAKTLADFEITIDPRAGLHNPANDAWYTMELFVRRAEQAMGPVTIKVPPSRARTAHTVAATNAPIPESPLAPTAPEAPAAPETSAVIPWKADTGRPATVSGRKRKSWPSTVISNNPNLVILNSTRDRVSKKRKMGDRDEADEAFTAKVTAEVTASNRTDESGGGCEGRPGKPFSSDVLQKVLQKQRGLMEEKLNYHKDGEK